MPANRPQAKAPSTVTIGSQTFYSVDAVAEIMRVKPGTVYTWIKTGRLHTRKHGRTSWATERDIQAMLTPVGS